MTHFLGTTNWNTLLLLAGRQCRLLAGVGLLAIGINASVAPPTFPFEAGQSLGTGVAAPPSDQARLRGEARLTPVAELIESLATARSRLDDLSRLTEQVAAKSDELGALRARERNILAEVQALHADRDARDAALARMEDFGRALEQATSITQALGQQLAAERRQNSELSDQNEELTAQLLRLRSAHASIEGEVANLRGQLDNSEQRLAAAAEVRTKTEAKLVLLEERSSEAEQKISGLETQIPPLQEQLKNKDAALEVLASLRTERDALRHRVTAIELELTSEQDENDRLSAELAVFRSEAETATDLARQHLLAVEGKIMELNEAASAASRRSELEVLRGPKLPPASGPRTHDDLTSALAPLPSALESADDPESSIEGQTVSHRPIVSSDAIEQATDTNLQADLLDALQQQRRSLEIMMKELGDDRK